MIRDTEPDEDADAARERRLPKDDDLARAEVVKFEELQGQKADQGDRYEAGYDVLSIGPQGVRKIEVKGLQQAWIEDACVSMTGRQFDDARRHDDGAEWWLYVVENLGSSTPHVIPIHNPASGARAFYLHAFHWRPRVSPRKLRAPDDDDESKD